MSVLLEIRERVKAFYSKNDVFIIPVVKFLIAFLTFYTINARMGYMARLDDVLVVLVGALLCSFLPVGCMLFFAAVLSLLHLYALAMEAALVGLGLYLILALLFFRFSPKDSLAVLLTPLLCALNLPYVMPIAMGLLGTPASAVSVCCGVVVYFFLYTVVGNEQAILALGEDEVIGRIQLVVDGLIDNKAMLVMLVAFAVTVVVVYLLRRLSVAYAWSIAMVTGALVNLVVLLIGDLRYDTSINVVQALLGTLIALVIAKLIEFCRFCVDYSRTERVQYEDDEYYYYVKAVPKMTVSTQSRTVKKINTQRRTVVTERTGSVRREETEEDYDDGGKAGQDWYEDPVRTARVVTSNHPAEGEYPDEKDGFELEDLEESGEYPDIDKYSDTDEYNDRYSDRYEDGDDYEEYEDDEDGGGKYDEEYEDDYDEDYEEDDEDRED